MPVFERQGTMMAFVVSTDVRKPDPELRKFIRSHVMMGKNRGKTLRPRKRASKAIRDPPLICDDDPAGPPGSSITGPHSVIPRKVGSDLSTVRFADVVDPCAVEVVLQSTVVLTLAAHAHFLGHSESATHHLQGLQKIIRLRGGITAFRDNAKLLVEILRCDIGVALDSGSKPMFFDNHSFEDPLPTYPDQPLLFNVEKVMAPDSPHGSNMFLVDIDDALVSAWRVLSRFCRLVNHAAKSNHRIRTEIYLDTMASVVYHLIYMSFEVGSADEAMRLGLLAFSTSIFLQWKQLGRSYTHLASTYRDSLARIGPSQLPPPLLLWLFMAGVVSVFEAADIESLKPWLGANIDLNGINSWSDMQGVLGTFMWVGLVQDQLGQEVFNSMLLEVRTRLLHFSP
ncbi:hypothetical protein DL770_009667 [Monosporascus sp. CRB-9-2]|nr:hypothetical protein DL770_009667 [Monosporascus sp. CRB-9-2]